MNISKILNNSILHLILLFIVSILVYSNTFQHGFGLDDHYIGSALERSGNTISGIFETYFSLGDYRPITILSFFIEQKNWGVIEPGRSHIINTIIYGLLCISIYLFILKLPIKKSKYYALLITLLFVVMPIHSEVVSSLKNRDNLLSMFFMMLSILSFFSAYNSEKMSKIYAVLQYLLSFVLLVLALLSKLDSISILFILILTLAVFYKVNYKRFALIIFVVAMVYYARSGMVREVTQDSPIAPSISYTENPIVESDKFSERLGLTINTYIIYLKMMIDPNENFFYYGYNTIPLKKVTNPQILFYLLVLLSFLFIGILLYKKNKLILYGYLFFGFSLIYASNLLVPVSGIVANRYAFIASLGFSIFAVSLIDFILNHLLSKVNQEKINKHKSTVITFFLLLTCFIYSTYTYSRNNDWKNVFTLFKADMPRLSNSFQANRIATSNVLYAGLNTQDKDQKPLLVKEALQYGLSAQKLFDKDPYINEKVGLAYQTLGQWEAAKSSYLLNTKLENQRSLTWEYLGDIYFTKENNFDSAAIAFSYAIGLEPTYDTPYFKFLNANYRSGKKEETYNYFRKLEEEQPENWIPTQCIGYYYLFEKDTLKGMQHIKMSFEKGFKDPYTAEYVKENLIKFGDIESAEKMNQFIQ